MTPDWISPTAIPVGSIATRDCDDSSASIAAPTAIAAGVLLALESPPVGAIRMIATATNTSMAFGI